MCVYISHMATTTDRKDEAMTTTITANIALGAVVNKKAQGEFERLVASPLMAAAARHYLSSGYTAAGMKATINSGAFFDEWINNGGESASLIGLPAAALVVVMQSIEEAGA